MLSGVPTVRSGPQEAVGTVAPKISEGLAILKLGMAIFEAFEEWIGPIRLSPSGEQKSRLASRVYSSGQSPRLFSVIAQEYMVLE